MASSSVSGADGHTGVQRQREGIARGGCQLSNCACSTCMQHAGASNECRKPIKHTHVSLPINPPFLARLHTCVQALPCMSEPVVQQAPRQNSDKLPCLFSRVHKRVQAHVGDGARPVRRHIPNQVCPGVKGHAGGA